MHFEMKRRSARIEKSGKECEICGFNLVLDIHHPEGWKLAHQNIITTPSGAKTYEEIQEPVEPDKAMILCPNCHALIHRKKLSPNTIRNYTRTFWRKKLKLSPAGG